MHLKTENTLALASLALMALIVASGVMLFL
jgi:hypothetical protein